MVKRARHSFRDNEIAVKPPLRRFTTQEAAPPPRARTSVAGRSSAGRVREPPPSWLSCLNHRFVPGAPEAATSGGAGISLVPRQKKKLREEEVETIDLTTTHPVPYLNPRPIRALPSVGGDGEVYDPMPIQMVPPLEVDRRPALLAPSPVDVEMYEQRSRPRPQSLRAVARAPVTDMRMVVAAPPDAEFGEFPVERDWILVGKSYVPGLSTNRGRRRLDAGEIVHFAFPSYAGEIGLRGRVQTPPAQRLCRGAAPPGEPTATGGTSVGLAARASGAGHGHGRRGEQKQGKKDRIPNIHMKVCNEIVH